MTSDDIFPRRFTEIDDLTRPDHRYLADEDVCYYIGEYTARRGHACSATNDLIQNFKKPVSRRGQPQWSYKERAIRQAAGAFAAALGSGALDRLTFVPVPPSKTKSDPLYDDRLTRMLHAVRPAPTPDVRDLLVQTESTEAVHAGGERPSPDRIATLYRIDEALTAPTPEFIAVDDDVLMTGAHYGAAKSLLSARFPGTRIAGLFIARRAPAASDV